MIARFPLILALVAGIAACGVGGASREELPPTFELEWRQNDGIEKWCDRENGTLIYRNRWNGGLAIIEEGCASDDPDADITEAKL